MALLVDQRTKTAPGMRGAPLVLWRPDPLRVILFLVLAVALLDSFSTVANLGNPASPDLDNLLPPIAFGLATGALWLARRRLGPAAPEYRSLGFFLLVFGLFGLAKCLRGLIGLGASSELGLVTLGTMIPTYLLGFGGLVTFPRTIVRMNRTRFVIDLVMVLTGGLMAFWQLIVRPFLAQGLGARSPDAWIICLLFPVLGFVLAAGLSSFVAGQPRTHSRSVTWTIIGTFACFMMADGLTAGVMVGGFPAWGAELRAPLQIGAAACMIWAALRLTAPKSIGPHLPQPILWGWLIPATSVGFGFLALAHAALSEGLSELVLAGGGALLVTVAVVGRNLEAHFGEMARRQLVNTQKAQADELAAAARRDELTGLANDLALNEWVDTMAPSGRINVALISLTSLRDLNKTLGFAVGNALLVEVAGRLRSFGGPSGLVTRFHGDAFALGLTGDVLAASLVVEEALDRLIKPFALAGQTVGLIINAGLGTRMPTDKGDPGAVIRRAAAARTVARATHRLLVIYESAPRPGLALPTSASVRLPELRTAIAEGGLILHYQPYLECASGRWIRAEALVRWPHPTAGLLAPGAFLPLAEAGGLMRQLDQWVLDEACRQAAIWRGAGYLIQVAINVSAASIHDPEYASSVLRALARHHLPGTAIEIEFTEESAFRGSDERLCALADELRALEVTLAIDDFGTGDSSLLRLRNLPVETIKIDRSFITNALSNPRDAAIIETVVTLAHRLNHKVVAEGIEDAATLKYLDAIGVDYIQGYFVCRPVAPETLIERLPQSSAESPVIPFVARAVAAARLRVDRAQSLSDPRRDRDQGTPLHRPLGRQSRLIGRPADASLVYSSRLAAPARRPRTSGIKAR